MAHATREYKTQVRGREHAGKGHVSPTAHALRMQAARTGRGHEAKAHETTGHR